jgi:hypothetical protein
VTTKIQAVRDRKCILAGAVSNGEQEGSNFQGHDIIFRHKREDSKNERQEIRHRSTPFSILIFNDMQDYESLKI